MNKDQYIKTEYSIISRGSELNGSKGYMCVSESINGSRFIVPYPHFTNRIESTEEGLLASEKYPISTIVVARFLLVSEIGLNGYCYDKNKTYLITGFGSVGFAVLLTLLNRGIHKVDIFIRNWNNYYREIYSLSILYSAHINFVYNIGEYDNYIETTGDPEVINSIVENASIFSNLFILGSPKGKIVDFDFYKIFRKNLSLIGCHELLGKTLNQRQLVFNDILENKISSLNLENFVSVYPASKEILNEIYLRKNNFFEALQYEM